MILGHMRLTLPSLMSASIKRTTLLGSIVMIHGALAKQVHADAVLDYSDPTGFVGSAGVDFGPGHVDVGQTFIAPFAPYLTSFEFSSVVMSSASTFKIAQWTGTAQSTVLFSQSVGTLSLPNSFIGSDVAVSTNFLRLTPGSTYVAYVESSQLPSRAQIYYGMDINSPQTYSNGSYVLLNPSLFNYPRKWSVAAFETTAFKATFATSIPEPSSLIFLAASSFGLVISRRRVP